MSTSEDAPKKKPKTKQIKPLWRLESTDRPLQRPETADIVLCQSTAEASTNPERKLTRGIRGRCQTQEASWPVAGPGADPDMLRDKEW